MSANLSQVSEEGARPGKLQVFFLVCDCAVLLVTLLFGSASNVFVLRAVRRQRSLQTATNALLVNLALVDLLRCAADCPLLLLVVLRARGRADLGHALCGAQLILFSLNCGAQLLTVAGISVERHRAVVKPFAERRKRVAAWIPVTWAAPAVASALCARFARDSPVYARCRGVHTRALRTYDSFGRYVLLPAWCACLAVIAVCYAHIFAVVRTHNRKIFDKGVLPPPGRKKGGDRKEEPRGSARTPHHIHTPQIKLTADMALSDRGPGEQKPVNAPKASDSQTPTTHSLTVVPELPENTPELLNVKGGKKLTSTQCASPAPYGTACVSLAQPENAPDLLDTEGGKKPTTTRFTSPTPFATECKSPPPFASECTFPPPFASECTSPPAFASECTFPPAFASECTSPPAFASECTSPPAFASECTSPPAFASECTFPPVFASECTFPPAFASEGTSPPAFATECPSLAQPKASEAQKVSEKLHEEVQQNIPENALQSTPQDAPQVSAPQDEQMMGAVCMMPSFTNRERGNKKKESKLAKRSGYIIFTFLIFWLPLMGTIVLNMVLNREESREVDVVQELEVLVVCIACMTSLTNPIIYAAVNPQFHTEFYYLRNKCKALCAKT